MINEAIRLSVLFFENIKGFERDETGKINAPDNYKVKVMKNTEQILAGGMKAKELETHLKRFQEENPLHKEAYNIEDVLSFFKIQAEKVIVEKDPNNLIESGNFYYHPALQVAPAPPTIVQLDDGTFVSSYDSEAFFLEMKESFTYDDLVHYFYQKMESNGQGFKERDIGAFKHILRSYDLDTVLYTIDEARFLAEDLSKPLPKSPFDIRDYFEHGMAVLEDRKNTCYMEGLNHVIPRAQ